MLIPNNIHPEHCIYFTGSIVLEVILEGQLDDLIDLYSKVNSRKEMSFSVFVLSLDWLFLLNIAEIQLDGRVRLCS
ncbi:ABC-three component system middle component 6 [Leptospira bandrabouensis]|uniref:Uncharacterized protein n=1 Tax=Leptospira bandrabouensis TaxID=2484903 RepID=A0A6H3NSQ6_9LEPT|nr:hypothetical protein EHR08_17105 [Leptospira bandrabouensis]